METEQVNNVVNPYITQSLRIAFVFLIFVIIYGGYRYISASGNPDKISNAKKIIINGLIGFVLVVSAGMVSSLFKSTYSPNVELATNTQVTLDKLENKNSDGLIDDMVKKATQSVMKSMILDMSKPVVKYTTQFFERTRSVTGNYAVMDSWKIARNISIGLFVLLAIILGFQIMSNEIFGFEPVEFRHLLPTLFFSFFMINTSVVWIEALINLSNGVVSIINGSNYWAQVIVRLPI